MDRTSKRLDEALTQLAKRAGHEIRDDAFTSKQFMKANKVGETLAWKLLKISREKGDIAPCKLIDPNTGRLTQGFYFTKKNIK